MTDSTDPSKPPEEPSHAVRCILEHKLLIVPDCAAEPDFRFYNEAQRGYLRSLIAFPINALDLNAAKLVRGALVVDTTEADFFREEERELYETCLKMVAELIRFQYDVKRLRRRESPEG